MVRENIYIIRKAIEPNSLCCYQDGSIGLKIVDNILTDDEFSEYLSDALTHEHLHKVLHELFNYTVSKLFDGIEEYFRNHALHEKQIRGRNLINEHLIPHESYRTYIKRCGFKSFLWYYDITQEDVIQAKQICSYKAK